LHGLEGTKGKIMADSLLDYAKDFLATNTGKGATLGALMSALLKSYKGPGGVNQGVDMSKVGNIAPRTTTIPTGRYVPYADYGARDIQTPTLTPELARVLGIPNTFNMPSASQYTATPRAVMSGLPKAVVNADPTMPATDTTGMPPTIRSAGTGLNTTLTPTLSAPVNNEIDPILGTLLGGALGSLMPSKKKDGGMAVPLMADGGEAASPSYYTFGQVVNPQDILNQLNQMAEGGQPKHGGLHVPVVEGRHDYRAGARVTGEGDGQSDDIPAMLADGEFVVDSETVSQLGNGSTKAGSDLLDEFRKAIREHKRSAPTDKIPPASSPLTYMKIAMQRTGMKK
jgi:hypothetical protein